MISKENIKYSLKNIWIKKSRSFLTLLSIFIGITTIFIFVSFGWGLYDYVNDLASGGSADKFTVQGKGAGAPGTSPVELKDADLKVIEKTKGVSDVVGIYFTTVEVVQKNKKKYTYLIGMDPSINVLDEMYSIKIVKGRKLKKDDVGKVVLGYNYLEDNKIMPKAYKLGDKIEINKNKMDIVGFYGAVGNPQDDSQVYVTKEYFQKLFPDKTYGMIIGRAELTKMESIVESVKKELRKYRNQKEGQEDFTVASFEDQIKAFTSALNIVIGFVIMIALISVIVSAVNTANTMITSVLERVREIGVIKSIGAKNSEIFNIFLFESSFLGFVAGVIGVILGWIITATAGSILKSLGWGFLAPHISASTFISGILFATIVGAISGVAPAINASKLKPVEALRYE
jgi:putative ABC transport system permease protein